MQIIRRIGYGEDVVKADKKEDLRKFISFSLFGNKRMYTEGAIQNVRLAKMIYPDWTVRIYCDENVSETVVERLSAHENCEIVVYKTLPKRMGQMCRFLPLGEEVRAVVIVRDADSRLNLREKRAVDEWIASGKRFHLMYESMHPTNTILGGMWGARCVRHTTKVDKCESISERFANVPIPGLDKAVQVCLGKSACGAYGDDMRFLDEHVLPLMNKENTVIHGKGGIPFQDERYGGYVGQVVLCKCPFEVYADRGCAHATRKVPSNVATLLHSSPKAIGCLSKFL